MEKLEKLGKSGKRWEKVVKSGEKWEKVGTIGEKWEQKFVWSKHVVITEPTRRTLRWQGDNT